MKVLVTGGVRSGKSFHAEALLIGEPSVTYVAPGPTVDDDPDPDWRARVEAHRSRRPSHWRTLERHDLAQALRETEGAILVDCLGTWLRAELDELDAWDSVLEDWEPLIRDRIDEAAEALAAAAGPVVVVTNEVGMGVVPEHRSGRIFRDLLGVANQRIALECDQVLLVVAGRPLAL